jgi:hypothetical protein
MNPNYPSCTHSQKNGTNANLNGEKTKIKLCYNLNEYKRCDIFFNSFLLKCTHFMTTTSFLYCPENKSTLVLEVKHYTEKQRFTNTTLKNNDLQTLHWKTTIYKHYTESIYQATRTSLQCSVCRSLFFSVVFVDRCFSFCAFSFRYVFSVFRQSKRKYQ